MEDSFFAFLLDVSINVHISTLPPFCVSGKYVDAILQIASLHQDSGET